LGHCGSTLWNQTLSYDPFGNVTKTGNPGGTWAPGYNQTNNHYLLADTTYDANGRLTEDSFDDPIQWDIDGNIWTQSSVGFAYDGLGRTAGSVVGSTWTNDIYAPDGGLFATADNSGNIKKMFVPLPMSTAVYSSGTLQQYRRNDWQGSVRVASTPSQTLFSDTAYSAFGEPYAPKGTTNNQFAGLTSDISSGTEQVSLSRRYHPGQGRWISPDGIIPDVFNPQTFNAYHYAFNRPNSTVDPLGLHEINDAVPNGDNGCYLSFSCVVFTDSLGMQIDSSVAMQELNNGSALVCPFSNCSHTQVNASGQWQVWQEGPDPATRCSPGAFCVGVRGHWVTLGGSGAALLAQGGRLPPSADGLTQFLKQATRNQQPGRGPNLTPANEPPPDLGGRDEQAIEALEKVAHAIIILMEHGEIFFDTLFVVMPAQELCAIQHNCEDPGPI
jgi:RHS repeat-associated protein